MKDMHFGKTLEKTLREQGRSVTWFADQLCCTRPNIYKLFRKESVDTNLVYRISKILQYDFFKKLSEDYQTNGHKTET